MNWTTRTVKTTLSIGFIVFISSISGTNELWAASPTEKAKSAKATEAKALSTRSALTVTEAYEAASAGELLLIDIRRPEEWRESGIPKGALAMDMTDKTFVARLKALRSEQPDKPIAFICAVGGRSSFLVTELRRHRFGNVIDVPAGVSSKKGWLAENLPTRTHP